MEYKIIKMVEETELIGRDFVGVSNGSDEDIQVSVPYGVNIPAIVDSLDFENMRFLKIYIKAIQKALNSKSVRKNIDELSVGIRHPLAAVNIISDYITFGLLVDFEIIEKRTTTGKIDLNRTVQKMVPSFIKGDLIYEEYITRRKRIVNDNYVAVVQGNIINHFMEHGGEILFGSKLRVPVSKIKLDKSVPLKLKRELSETFNSRKQMIIRWMLEYLDGVDINKEKGEWNYAIIASSLWETIITSVYGNKTVVNKTEYGKQYAFYSLSDFHHHRPIKKGSSTQHDTIYEDDRQIIIIDAKMYGNEGNLLSEEVLGKQFGYYSEAKKKQLGKRILNLLFTPTIVENGGVDGFADEYITDPDVTAADDPDRLIFIYRCNANQLIKDYYYSHKKYDVLVADVDEFVNVRCRPLLDARGTSY